jgi:hypothetical protein
MTITHDFATLDSCDDPTVWTPTGQGAVSLNTTDYKQGSGALNIYKTGTAGVDFGAYKTIPATNLKDEIVVLWLYIKDNATLSKINVARVYIYDSAGNYDYFDIKTNPNDTEFNPLPLRVGWNVIRFFVGEYDNRYWPCYNYAGSSATKPDTTAITKIAIYFETVNAGDTIAEGSLVMDYWHAGTKITVSEGTWSSPLDFDYLYTFDASNALGVIDKLHERNYHLWCGVGGSYLYFDRGSLTIERNFTFNPTIKVEKAFVWHKYASYGRSAPDGEFYDSSIYVDGYVNFSADLTRCSLTAVYYLCGYSGLHGRHSNVIDSFINVTTDVTCGNLIQNSKVWLNRLLNLYFTTIQESTVIPTAIISIQSSATNSVNYFKNVVVQGGFAYAYYYSGTLYWQYSFDLILLDYNGNPISGATVSLYDKDGNLVFSATTDTNGAIPTQWVTAKKVVWSGGAATETDYNPFRLVVTLGSQKLVDYKLTIYEKKVMKISTHNLYTMDAMPEKAYYQLNENVIIKARFYDWNNTPITGLTVNATITKPDGSTITIPLKDDGFPPDEVANDGIYTGQFTDTSQVGTYYVEVSTTIYGNTVKATTSFTVGTIEKLIAEIRRLIF